MQVDTIYRRAGKALEKPEVKKKIKLGLVLLIFCNIFLWSFGSYFLTRPGQAQADQSAYTYNFATTSESWVGNGGSDTTDTYQSGAGNPAGSVQSRIYGRNKTNANAGWLRTGITWENLNIPAGSTITSVDGSYDWRCSEWNVGNTASASGNLTITDGSGGNSTTLETGVALSGTTVWATRNATGAVSIPSALQPSDSIINIRLLGNLQTGANNAAAVTRQMDTVVLTINYTPPVPALTQTGYHWRNNDGDEAGATSRTDGVENTSIISNKNVVLRLRVQVKNDYANHGGASFRVEYAQTDTCSSGSYTPIPVSPTTEHFNMADAQFIDDGTTTTDVSVSTGGVSNPSGKNFKAGQFKESGNTTSSISLNSNEFTEVEYSFTANNNSLWNTQYCFRVTNNGTALDSYSQYAQLTMANEEQNIEQVSYRWRNDNGSEIGGDSINKGPSRNEVVQNGWTDPGNAYSLTDDDVYATAAPAKNNNVISNFTDFGFDAQIPSGVTIDSVNITAQYRLSTNGSITIFTITPVVYGSLCGDGEADTSQPTSDYDVLHDATTCRSWVRDDLLDANFKVRVDARRGNSNTAVTFYLDFVKVSVSYSTEGATFKQDENTPHSGQTTNENIRLRTMVKNTGGAISQIYKVQYVSKTAACDTISSGWATIPVTATAEHFEFTTSTWFSDQDPTQNIDPGLSDPTGIFVAGYLVQDPSNATSAISLPKDNFTEIEYNFQANDSASGTYCFRLVRGSSETELDIYTNYPELAVGISNNSPNTPATLTQKTSPGGVTITESAWTNDNSPDLGFTITDTDGDTVKYRVQIDGTSSAFSNLVLDYTHGSLSVSGTTFVYTIGQSGGTYTIGSESMTLSDSATGYWWRVMAIDEYDATSSYVEFGVAGTVDFKVDATPPSGGTVNDGQLTGGDLDWNVDGSLTEYLANWTLTAPNSDVSGLSKYEYAVRRGSDNHYWTPGSPGSWGATEYWYDNGTNTTFTVSNINLQTSTLYYVSLKTTDNAGNTATINSNGLRITPLLSYSINNNVVDFSDLNNANNWTDTKSTVTTVSTNAAGGYSIYTYLSDYLRSIINPSFYIDKFTKGSYGSPVLWGTNCKDDNTYCGFGYTVNPSTRFSNGTLFAPYNHNAPGDAAVERSGPVNGSTGAINNEQFTITHKVSVDATQAASTYQTLLYLTVTANY